MNDKVAEEIKMHSEVIQRDSNSPLHLIREKELEISGRVLKAKREADEIVASARKQAGEIVQKAEAEGGSSAAEIEKKIIAKAAREAEDVRASAESEASELEARIDTKRQAAVRIVLDAVTRV